MTATPGPGRLTGTDRETIGHAREISAISLTNVRDWTGDKDLGVACAVAFGRAQDQIRHLLAIIERLAQEAAQ